MWCISVPSVIFAGELSVFVWLFRLIFIWWSGSSMWARVPLDHTHSTLLKSNLYILVPIFLFSVNFEDFRKFKVILLFETISNSNFRQSVANFFKQIRFSPFYSSFALCKSKIGVFSWYRIEKVTGNLCSLTEATSLFCSLFKTSRRRKPKFCGLMEIIGRFLIHDLTVNL